MAGCCWREKLETSSRVMAGLRRLSHYPRACFTICVFTVIISLLFTRDLRTRQQEERHKRDFLNSTEIPAEHIDPAAIDLTPLVNTLINSSQLGSRQLFSLLSVTSYSSLALHKLTLLVYNISNTKNIESNMFRRRFCYCVNNDTNDLTDFTAILLDVMGNSTSYLQELFKSASILSVSQKNNSDCIYICVMAGKMGKHTPELWDVGSITPFFNQTIVEGPHQVVNGSSIRLPIGWHQLPTNLSHMSPSGMSSLLASRVHSTAHASLAPVVETPAATEKILDEQPPLMSTQPVTTTPPHRTTTEQTDTTEVKTTLRSTRSAATQRMERTSRTVTIPHWSSTMRQADTPVPKTELNKAVSSSTASLTSPGGTTTQLLTPSLYRTTRGPPTAGPTVTRGTTAHLIWRTTTPIIPTTTERPGCPWRRPELMTESVALDVAPTVGAHKLQPCVLELCKFFSQCLCKPFSHKTRMKRYCDDSHLWYEKHTSEVCRRVRRVSFSKNLKQRCLTKMCNKL